MLGVLLCVASCLRKKEKERERGRKKLSNFSKSWPGSELKASPGSHGWVSVRRGLQARCPCSPSCSAFSLCGGTTPRMSLEILKPQSWLLIFSYCFLIKTTHVIWNPNKCIPCPIWWWHFSLTRSVRRKKRMCESAPPSSGSRHPILVG